MQLFWLHYNCFLEGLHSFSTSPYMINPVLEPPSPPVSSPYIRWRWSVATEVIRPNLRKCSSSRVFHFLLSWVGTLRRQSSPPTSFIDRPFTPLLPEAVYPKGEWLSIPGSALRCAGSWLNALWFPYCASWRRGRAGKMKSWVIKDRKGIGNCPSV